MPKEDQLEAPVDEGIEVKMNPVGGSLGDGQARKTCEKDSGGRKAPVNGAAGDEQGPA